MLGAAMFTVEIAGMRALYTGDYSRAADRHLPAADLPDAHPHIGTCLPVEPRASHASMCGHITHAEPLRYRYPLDWSCRYSICMPRPCRLQRNLSAGLHRWQRHASGSTLSIATSRGGQQQRQQHVLPPICAPCADPACACSHCRVHLRRVTPPAARGAGGALLRESAPDSGPGRPSPAARGGPRPCTGLAPSPGSHTPACSYVPPPAGRPVHAAGTHSQPAAVQIAVWSALICVRPDGSSACLLIG